MPRNSLPPGQYVPRDWPVLHYGPVPRFKAHSWDFWIFGATASGHDQCLNAQEFAGLPRADVVADLHCVTKFSVPDNAWWGVSAATILDVAPPHDDITHVMVWAEFGYSANMRVDDFAAEHTLFATHCDGEALTPEHGYPLRLIVSHLYAWKSVKWVRGVEYLTQDRRGFWEERGYHNIAEVWREQRYTHQEETGEGPDL